MISVYALGCGLHDSQKDDPYDRFISVVRKSGEKKIVFIAGDFNSHNESNPENYVVQLGVMVMELGARKEK